MFYYMLYAVHNVDIPILPHYYLVASAGVKKKKKKYGDNLH